MRELQIEDYIKMFLNNLEPKAISEVKPVLQALYIYTQGLLGKDFPTDIWDMDIPLKEFPVQFHTLIAHLAIIKSGEAKTEMVDKMAKDILEYYKDYLTETK